MSGSLVAAPENEDAQPLDSWEGAGVASSYADVGAALSEDEIDPARLGFAVAGAAIDTLGAIADPFEALASSVAGWLIEHIWFLHEPLDALAGDPTQITAQSKTWHNVSAELADLAVEYRAKAPGPPDWEGLAGDAYRRTVEDFSVDLEAVARNAEQLSGLILTTGVAVGTVRGTIRDMLAEFIGELIAEVALWVAAAFFTFGGALAAGVARVVLWALDLAADIARRISRLLDALHAAGGTAGRIADSVRETAARARAARPGFQQRAGELHEKLDDEYGDLIEVGKQHTTAEQDRRGWDEG